LHSHYPPSQDYQDYPGHRPPSHWGGGPRQRHPYGVSRRHWDGTRNGSIFMLNLPAY
jgi:hypothetical protein